MTRQLPKSYDVLAPDGSEIRLVGATAGGSMVHCVLPAGATSTAVRHRSVHEIWLVTAGSGEIWVGGEVRPLQPGTIVDIAVGTSFQFRAETELTIVIMTTPPWPGADEAVVVDGGWPPTIGG